MRKRYSSSGRKALSGELCPWEATPEGALALVIALDQFPVNMFRGRAHAFDGEAAARAAEARAIAQRFDTWLPPQQRAFLYLPYMHSDSETDQDRCVELCQGAGLEETLKYALYHREIVRRFGRFPHRNGVSWGGKARLPSASTWYHRRRSAADERPAPLSSRRMEDVRGEGFPGARWLWCDGVGRGVPCLPPSAWL
jgi:uncharacterized protein (DUF924 family)